MVYRFRKILTAVLFFSLIACSAESTLPKKKIITLKAQPVFKPLYYSGMIQPLNTIVVVSPADGVVSDIYFQYGEKVKSGKLLLKLSSKKFLSDYKAALTQYLKAKNEFNTSESRFKESEFLYKQELISKDDYKMNQSNLYTSQLALLQARDVLSALLMQLDVEKTDLYQLTIADVDRITQAMHTRIGEDLQVVSPANGVLLSPLKNEEENKKIVKGDAIKQGDVLLVIGATQGISVRIKVNELSVNQLKLGQRVNVTGIAFPEFTLEGEIHRIDRQGESINGSIPNFNVEVIVPKLSVAQQQLIHVGMSAKVEIKQEEKNSLMVPLSAIGEKNGIYYVKLYDDKTQLAQEVAVKTGPTTMDAVVILSSLKQGDKIVVPY